MKLVLEHRVENAKFFSWEERTLINILYRFLQNTQEVLKRIGQSLQVVESWPCTAKNN